MLVVVLKIPSADGYFVSDGTISMVGELSTGGKTTVPVHWRIQCIKNRNSFLKEGFFGL